MGCSRRETRAGVVAWSLWLSAASLAQPQTTVLLAAVPPPPEGRGLAGGDSTRRPAAAPTTSGATPAPLDAQLLRAVDREAEDVEAVRAVLARGADPGAVAENGLSALALAISHGHPRVARELIDAGADAGSHYVLAMAQACASQRPQLVQDLLDAGADVRLAGYQGRTALHWAAEGQSAEIVRALLDAGAGVDALEDGGRTPLMLSAVKGSAAAALMLLDAGADASRKNRDGKAAAELAREAGQQKWLQSVQGWINVRRAEAGNAIRLRPGDNLPAAVQRARDGQVIVLGEGRYGGQLAVVGKSLVIRGTSPEKTMLAVNDEQAVAYAGEKSKLELENLSIEATGKADFAVAAVGGHVVARNCLISRPVGNAGLSTRGGRLEFQNCRFVGAREWTLTAQEQSTLIVRACVFDRCGSGVLAKGAAALGVFDSEFLGTPKAIASEGAGTAVAAYLNRIDQPADPAGKSFGVYVNGARRLVLSGNRVVNAPLGVVVRGRLANPAQISRTVTFNANQGIQLSATYEGKRATARLVRNIAYRPRQAGVAVDGAPRVELSLNLAVCEKASGIVLSRTSAKMERNLVYAPWSVALSLREGAKATLAGERYIGLVVPEAAAAAMDERSRRYAAAGRIDTLMPPLHQAAAEFLRAVARIERYADIKNASPFSREFNAKLGEVEKSAEQLAKVSLVGVDMAQTRRPLELSAYRDLGGAPGHTELSNIDLHDPRAFAAALADPQSALARHLASLLAEDLKARLKAAPDDPALLGPALAQVNAKLNLDGVYDAALADGARISPRTEALAGQRKVLPNNDKEAFFRRLNREVLEQAWPAVVRSSQSIDKADAAFPFVFVPAGRHWFVPSEHPGLIARQSIESGQVRELESFADDSLWLTFVRNQDKPPLTMLLPMRSWSQMQETTRQYAGQGIRYVRPALRAEATAEQARAALEVARRAFPAAATPFKLRAGDPKNAAQRHNMRHHFVQSILLVAGTSEDAGRVIDSCRGRDWEYARQWCGVAAYIEARLGTLDRGRLVAALSSPEAPVAAAAAFHLAMHGVDAGQRVLIEGMRKQPAWLDGIMPALRHNNSAELLEAVRASVREPSRAADPVSAAVVRHLLAYGHKQDLRNLSARRMTLWSGVSLLPYLEDPSDLTRLLVFEGYGDALKWQLPFLLAQDRLRGLQFVSNTGNAIFNAAYPRGAHYGAFRDWERDVSYIVPQPNMASNVFDGADPRLGRNWTPALMQDPVKQLLSMQAVAVRTIDYLTHEDLTRRLAEEGAAETLSSEIVNLVIAAHRISTCAFSDPNGEHQDATQRRPFTLRETGEDGGALSSVIRLRPSLVDGTLRCAVTIDSKAHYPAVAFIDGRKATDFTIHKYVVGGGRSLIGGMRVRRGDGFINMREAGRDEEGRWVFEADVGQGDFAGLYAVVDLTFFKQSPNLVFELFSGGAAASLRRQSARIAAGRRNLPGAPGREALLELAREQAEAGKLAEAWKTYQQAIALNRSDGGLWREAARLFSDARRFAQAAEVLRGAVAALPNDAELHAWLAGVLFGEGQYRAAADAAKAALDAGADPGQLSYTRAVSLYLAGDYTAAERTARDALPGPRGARAAAIAYFCAIKTGGDAKKVQAALPANAANAADQLALDLLAGRVDEARALADAPTEAQRCRLLAYAAYRALAQGKNDHAASQFKAALATGRADQVEYRMARSELREMEASP